MVSVDWSTTERVCTVKGSTGMRVTMAGAAALAEGDVVGCTEDGAEVKLEGIRCCRCVVIGTEYKASFGLNLHSCGCGC